MSDEKGPPTGGQEDPPNDPPRPARRPYGALDGGALIDAMRAGDSRAIDEFTIRHQRLLFERARLAGIGRRDCEDHIIEVVEDVAMLIVARRIQPTKALGAYVVASFFNRLADAIEDGKRRRQVVRENAEDPPGLEDRTIMSLVSEGSIRDSQGPAWECVPVLEPLRRLASMIEEGLSTDDEQLLSWHSRYVPLRQIAAWLGISYAAAAKRSWRLREEMRESATRYAFSFTPQERRQLADFFDRCSATYHPDLRSGTDNHPPTRSA